MKNYSTEVDDNVFQIFPGITPGEGYLREVGAYLIDRQQRNTAGVPTTVICESYHPAYNYSASGSSNTNSSLGTAKPGNPFSVKYESFQTILSPRKRFQQSLFFQIDQLGHQPRHTRFR
jgi:hypothetical protein